MKHQTLYPPGGGEPVVVHASKVEHKKAQGWTDQAPKKKAKPKPPPETDNTTQ